MRLKTMIFAVSMLLLFGFSIGCSKPSSTAPAAAKIKQSIQQAGMKNVDVKNDSQQRVIQLTGDVETQSAKDRAEQIAKHAAPGYTVADEILVKPEGEAGDRAEDIASNMDDAINIGLQDAMAEHSWTKDHDINFDVKNGVVTLTGDVKTTEQRSQLSEIVKSVSGVQQVVNEVKIQGRTTTASE